MIKYRINYFNNNQYGGNPKYEAKLGTIKSITMHGLNNHADLDYIAENELHIPNVNEFFNNFIFSGNQFTYFMIGANCLYDYDITQYHKIVNPEFLTINDIPAIFHNREYLCLLQQFPIFIKDLIKQIQQGVGIKINIICMDSQTEKKRHLVELMSTIGLSFTETYMNQTITKYVSDIVTIYYIKTNFPAFVDAKTLKFDMRKRWDAEMSNTVTNRERRRRLVEVDYVRMTESFLHLDRIEELTLSFYKNFNNFIEKHEQNRSAIIVVNYVKQYINSQMTVMSVETNYGYKYFPDIVHSFDKNALDKPTQKVLLNWGSPSDELTHTNFYPNVLYPEHYLIEYGYNDNVRANKFVLTNLKPFINYAFDHPLISSIKINLIDDVVVIQKS
jgi:hypothetical protein